MENRCFRCADKFGVFKKEIACRKCGFGFCKKCLPHQVQLSSSQPEPVPVCNKCFQSLHQTSGNQKPASQGSKYDELPENFKKRVAALQAKEEASGKPMKSKGGQKLSAADQDIASRLEKLKAGKKQAMGRALSFEEMESRLRVLKGLPSQSDEGHQTKSHQPPDPRTNHEKSQDLVTQMTEEVNMDSRLAGSSSREADDTEEIDEYASQEDSAKSLEDEVKNVLDEAKRELSDAAQGRKNDAEMEERLAKLQGMDAQTYRDQGRKAMENMSEEEATKRYIAKLLEESRLDDKMDSDGYSQLVEDSKTTHVQKKKAAVDPDELPWCCICNEDAALRCHDCDDDLYCKSCFREGHDEFDMKHHRISKYKAPKDAER
ncbi:putative abscission/NoCut checkpoint regulator isoform X3 [Apostichopus japonicus]|uniref:Putative abscission/NoCut checkpoint regulator isoform X3 n=1 Tax=Stichopus japonicus TaxID=307972 RepID=A0A2G8KIQ6_STIJA|nr:putative abscission/NoCut checkpoint regulator isoform X3 [Apostichopus japonicus]